MPNIISNNTNSGYLYSYQLPKSTYTWAQWVGYTGPSDTAYVNPANMTTQVDGTQPTFWVGNRAYVVFDTTSIGPSTSVSNFTLNLYKYTTFAPAQFICRKATLPNMSTALTVAHWPTTNFTGVYSSAATTLTPPGWISIPLNSLAVTDAQTSNTMTIGLQNFTYDYSGAIPTGIQQYTPFYLATPGFFPYLSYTGRPTVNGVTAANQEKIDGVVQTSIQRINGV